MARIFNFGPVALTTTMTTNLLNAGTGARATPPTGFTEPGIFIVLKHIRVTNKTSSAVSFSLWKGATGANAAGTEVVGSGQSVAANSSYDWYGLMRLDPADFLVGGASASTSLSLVAEGELIVGG